MEVAKVNGEEEEEVMHPPGFRFHPTDEELVGFYLQRKVEKKPLPIELIKQIDIYKYDPWDLPKVSCVGETEGYFFCRRGRKYRNSMRPNRVSGSGSGFWKATGIDKAIYGGGGGGGVRSEQPQLSIIGLKKSLVYYRGSAGKGTKTDWMMHEFRLPPTNNNTTIPKVQEAEVWTLCRIFKRIPAYKKYTPTLKETAAAAAKPNPTHSTSKTYSSETDNGKPYLTFKDSLIIQQNDEIKNQIMNIEQVDCERNHLFLGQFGPGAQATPPTLSYPRFWSPNVVEDVFADGNWDELGPVVQFAIDQSKVYYDCTEYFGEILS